MRTLDIAWLGGLLEGEGSFWHRPSSPTISLGLTDQDTLVKAAKLLGCRARDPLPPKLRHKPVWTCSIHGGRAAGWMMTLYPFLGARRQAKVRETLARWRAIPGWSRMPRVAKWQATCHPDRVQHCRGLCQQCYSAKYVADNREARLAYAAKYRAEHRLELRDQMRALRAKRKADAA